MFSLDEASKQGPFKILYFHSMVSGKQNGAHHLIKHLCNRMSETMMDYNKGIHLIHSNFSLNTSLLFYRHRLFMKSFKIRNSDTLPDLFDLITPEERTFVESKLPLDIKIHDEGVKESMGIERVKTMKVSDSKVVKIDAISKEDERYLDFDYESAV